MKKPTKTKNSFSAKQRRTRFIQEFLKEHNATKAAIASGFSEKTAGSQGQRLLKNVEVRAAIEKANNAVNEKLNITVERVKEELARLAFYDPRKFFNNDGSAKPLNELDEESARALAGIDVAELFAGSGEDRAAIGYLKKIKLANKLDALEQLARHLQMFTDKVEISAGDNLIAKLMEGRKRAATKR